MWLRPPEAILFWVVDYLRHPFSVNSISESPDRDCGFMGLDVDGTGAEILYYGINGRRFTLDRGISLAYRTLVPDVENMTFVETAREKSLEFLESPLRLEGVLCPTDFVITGDRFLQEWGDAVQYTSPVIQPYSVSAITSAVQTERENDNEVNPGAETHRLEALLPVRFLLRLLSPTALYSGNGSCRGSRILMSLI